RDPPTPARGRRHGSRRRRRRGRERRRAPHADGRGRDDRGPGRRARRCVPVVGDRRNARHRRAPHAGRRCGRPARRSGLARRHPGAAGRGARQHRGVDPARTAAGEHAAHLTMRCGPTPAASAITAREKCAFLSDPESYPERPRAVEILDTHFAWVFLTDRHVFKMKKAVRRGTMDYATLAARERNCRNELELNRRLAPSVYLEVLPLSLAGGRLVLGPGEETVEWLVRMRRLPEDRQLDHAIAKGTVTASDLDEVIALLAEFYRNTHREPMTPDAW